MPAAMLRGSDGRWKVARWRRKLPAQEPLAPRLFLVQLPRGLEQVAAADHAKQLLRLLRFHHRQPLQAKRGHARGDGAAGFLRQRVRGRDALQQFRSEEHTSELQSLMRISYAVFCLKKKNKH